MPNTQPIDPTDITDTTQPTEDIPVTDANENEVDTSVEPVVDEIEEGSKLDIDPRHVARAIALQQLFTNLIPEATDFPADTLLEELGAAEYDAKLVAEIVAGVTEKLPEIDPIITKFAPEWPIEQIFNIDLIILRMGIWEAFLSKITPAKVVINECIELAKEFGGENSSSFINGVLGNILQQKEQEKAA